MFSAPMLFLTLGFTAGVLALIAIVWALWTGPGSLERGTCDLPLDGGEE